MRQQMTFTDLEQSAKKKQTRREVFLAEMDQVMSWAELEAVIEPVYPKPGNGRRPYPLSTMLRIHCLQQWYGLSDPAMEESLYEIASMRHFANVGIDTIPDETTLLNFRHLLEKHQLATALFETINRHLSAKGLMLRQGTIVDATLIHAPSSTKNANGERDPEMHQTKKGNQWYFGMKAHIGVDAQSGLVHHVEGTAANVADIVMVDKLLHGGDAGFTGIHKREEHQQRSVNWWQEGQVAERIDRLGPETGRQALAVVVDGGTGPGVHGERLRQHRGIGRRSAEFQSMELNHSGTLPSPLTDAP